jgi:hypothetical protein
MGREGIQHFRTQRHWVSNIPIPFSLQLRCTHGVPRAAGLRLVTSCCERPRSFALIPFCPRISALALLGRRGNRRAIVASLDNRKPSIASSADGFDFIALYFFYPHFSLRLIIPEMLTFNFRSLHVVHPFLDFLCALLFGGSAFGGTMRPNMFPLDAEDLAGLMISRGKSD